MTQFRVLMLASAAMLTVGCSGDPAHPEPVTLEVADPPSSGNGTVPQTTPDGRPSDPAAVTGGPWADQTGEGTDLCAGVAAIYEDFDQTPPPADLEGTITLVDQILGRWETLRPLVPPTASEALSALDRYGVEIRTELDSGQPSSDIVERALDAGVVGSIARDFCRIDR